MTSLEFSTSTAVLARAASRADRLLPTRAARPAGVLLSAADQAVRVSAVDGETAVWGVVPATVHVPGDVLVGRRALASTLAALDAPEVRLRVEGSRLAVRTESARFALPLMDSAAQPRLPEPPPIAGQVDTAALRAAVTVVAAMASRDGLPLFTGVRIRSAADRVTLLATDRFRLAVATLPWAPSPGGQPIDVLIPAVTLGDAARQLDGPAVTLRAAPGAMALEWGEHAGGVAVASLALPFPDAQLDRLLHVRAECTLDVSADRLRAAVERAMPFAGDAGSVSLDAGDGVVVVRGAQTPSGDSREEVKASVDGDRVTASYQGRYLIDGLRAFAGRRVLVRLQRGIAPTEIADADPADGDLRCLVVPLRPRG